MKKNGTVATNKKAFFNYEILEKNEAGVVLTGCEVKSIRQGHITIKEAYVRLIKHELWLINCNILPYEQGNRSNGDPSRDRKLLVHKHELKKLIGKTAQKGFVIVPLSVYFSKNRVKVQYGVARPKKLHDKRRDLKEKAVQRELDRQGKY